MFAGQKVLVPTWFGFAIAGMIMFGRRMQVDVLVGKLGGVL